MKIFQNELPMKGTAQVLIWKPCCTSFKTMFVSCASECIFEAVLSSGLVNSGQKLGIKQFLLETQTQESLPASVFGWQHLKCNELCIGAQRWIT